MEVAKVLLVKFVKYSLLFVGVCLSYGCAETGDFGRRRPGLFEGKQGIDAPPQWFGSRATLTDNEMDFRNRALTLSRNPEKSLYPTLDALEAVIGADADAYYSRVAGLADLSVTARYKRVQRDASADLALIPLYRLAACRVASDDSRRLAALEVSTGLTQEQAELARYRVASNASLGEAVERALPQRIEAYHITLQRLFVGSPDEEGRRTLEAIAELRSEVAKGGGCMVGRPRSDRHIIRKG